MFALAAQAAASPPPQSPTGPAPKPGPKQDPRAGRQQPDPTPIPARETAAERQARLRRLAIRAACIRHFVSYSRWPSERLPSRTSPLVVGIVGTDPFGAVLDKAFRDKPVNGRRVVVRRYGSYAQLENSDVLAAAHLLYVAESDPTVQGRVLEALRDRSVLLVSASPGFAAAGGHIQTFVENNKPRFEINRTAIEARQMSCSAALLKHSRTGPRRPTPEPVPGSGSGSGTETPPGERPTPNPPGTGATGGAGGTRRPEGGGQQTPRRGRNR